MRSLSLCLLGGFRAELNGTPVAGFESNKVRALLAYLAVEAGRAHQRSALAGLLWPDHPEELARTNLRHVLRQLRQTIPDADGDAPLLLTTQQTLQINPAAAYTLDVARFAELLAACAACKHVAPDECPNCMERHRQAAGLYRGPFLAGFDLHDSDIFDEWAVTQREQLHRQVLEVFFTLASFYERHEQYDLARQFAWRQIELEPWREESHRQLMRVLARSGQRTAALAQYAQCRTILADELGVEPDPETLALYEAIRAGTSFELRVVSSELPRDQVRTRNLELKTHFEDWGEAPTSAYFYGRHAELSQLQQWLLLEQRRLVIVLGMGGMGKTTLVARAAKLVSDQFEIVFWRSLLNAPPLTELLRESLRFLSGQQLAKMPDSLGEQLTLLFDYLRQYRCLLVLDNLESILEAGQAAVPAGLCRLRPADRAHGQERSPELPAPNQPRAAAGDAAASGG